MKKILVVLFAFSTIFILAACGVQETEVSYEDGRYRGIYLDRDEVQVVVQFDLEDNVVTGISFRWLAYNGTDYRSSEDDTILAIRDQHQEAIDYLVGKDLREALMDLYSPGDIGVSDVSDAFTGATIRSNKIVSAIRDALNRGVYSY